MRMRHIAARPASVARSRRLAAAAATAILAAVIVVGCTAQTAPVEGGNPASGLGGCASPTRVIGTGPFAPELEGTSEDGLSLFGQIQADEFLVASGEVKKVVWRISGSGEPTVRLVGPGGDESMPSWGPKHHSASNYDRPGDEYGTGLVLDQPGCWQVEFTRGSETANVWLIVAA